MTPTVGDKIIFRGSDAVGAEWQDILIVLTTATKDMDDVATQAEILSDATPFPGANIDAAISSMTANMWNRLTSALTIAGSIGKLLVDYINVAVSTRTTLGAGAITFTYTLTSTVDGSPIADADVWVTTDVEGNHVVASGRTNSSGVVTFYLDAGTRYLWRQRDGFNFDNPDTEVVS